MEYKVCNECNVLKSVTMFYKDKNGKFGVRSKCKECDKKRHKDYYSENKEYVKDRIKIWKNKIKENGSLQYWNIRAGKINERAKKYNINQSINGKELMDLYEQQKFRCYYCNYKIIDSFHIDHYIPLSKGGNNTIKNIYITCDYCNLHKSDKIINNEEDYFKYIEQIYLNLYPKYYNKDNTEGRNK